ncbi:heavy metal sensor histidine kinase [Azoarcus taiwanensis]|uniref:Sensor protein n=1 Tax=Azoarcus taiwanensis TaxID=666964 RepID=A0A972JB36_9RHOO|nr:heavy metal sensor histidine kinase [Azoarcus taiwanensis]NMG03052.1 heavy metal sensor histidine kinase [Azoarcus taiwanensis]
MSVAETGGLSLTARLAALFASMASGLLIVVGIAVDRAVSAHFDELDQHELAAKLVAVETLLATTGSDDALALLPGRLDDALAGHDTVALRLSIPARDWQHAVLDDRFASLTVPAPDRRGAELMKWRDARGTPFIGKAATVQVRLPESVAAEVLLGLDTSHHAHFLRAMRVQLGLGISAAAVLAAMLGWLAAKKGLAPMRRVTATASRLSAERLGERLSERDAPAEMRELVEAFNGMLERLEASFRRLNEFSADIAHELRTPVSNLMTETQVALSRSRSADEYREVLHSNLEEFDRLARMIADMLFLAKADNGLLPKPAETVALEVEGAALLEFYEALADEKGIRMKLSGAGQVIGDRLMLRRALSNLLSNAIRHTPLGETVEVAIQADVGQVKLAVSNPGEPIPPDQVPLVFERFHRADPSRLRQSDGSGLGLSITRSIVEAHGGYIDLNSESTGTVFTITLPARFLEKR